MATEAELIARTPAPITPLTLTNDLRSLGLRDGDIVLVHCSLSALGWVAGGAVSVVLALLDVVGQSGTLVVPTHTTGLTDPAGWRNPPVPEAWWQTVRDEAPAFDPAVTPTILGAVAEVARTWPGARRSAHPHVSFAAIGPAAAAIVDGHERAYGLGEQSPLARLYDRDARVLLLGVGHASNTSMHLAEYRAGAREPTREGGATLVDGVRRWETWDDVGIDSDEFEVIGAAFTGARSGRVGIGTALLMSQREVVDFATEWFRSLERRV